MNRETWTGAGCVLVALIAGVIFVGGSMAGDMAQSNRAFTLALYIFAGGVVLMLVVNIVSTWIEIRAQETAKQSLIERAEQLRQERESRRTARRQELDVALETLITGPRIAPSSPPAAPVARATADQGLCPLCQTDVLAGEQFVTCPACGMPYHADCWQYNTGCAVRGCTSAPAA